MANRRNSSNVMSNETMMTGRMGRASHFGSDSFMQGGRAEPGEWFPLLKSPPPENPGWRHDVASLLLEGEFCPWG